MEKGRGSVRLKFWQKTYLLTLALFLLALGGGHNGHCVRQSAACV